MPATAWKLVTAHAPPCHEEGYDGVGLYCLGIRVRHKVLIINVVEKVGHAEFIRNRAFVWLNRRRSGLYHVF